MYSLNYDMVIQVLQQYHYSGEVRADVPVESKLKGGGHVILTVQNGEIKSCLLFNKKEQKSYQGAEAARLLSKLGVLEWQLPSLTDRRSAAHAPVQQSPLEASTYVAPRRLIIPQEWMATWPTLQRSVYSLSDGTHTVKQIALLLSQPINVVEQMIYDLQKMGVLEKR
jgi:hypothetical protein